MVPETIRDGRETVGDISGGKGAGLRSPSPVVIFIGEGGPRRSTWGPRMPGRRTSGLLGC